jgi:oxygen-independent coproporphyrinogen-3 oxidase
VITVYERRVASGEVPTLRGHILSDDDRHRADLIRSLMTSGRAPLIAADRDAARSELADLVRDGIVEIGERELRVPPKGRPFIRNIAAFFDTYLRTATKEGPVYSRAI